MQYFTIVSALLAVASVSGSALPATEQPAFTNLESCLDYAASLNNKAASIGFANGCRAHFAGEDLNKLMARSYPEVSKNKASALTARDNCNGDEHGACCCELLCTYDLSCPACATGCVTSCETMYGADCAFVLSSCEDGSCVSS